MLRRLIFRLIVLGLTVAAGEVALQMASAMSRSIQRALAAPWERDAPLMPDDRLVWRGNPFYPDHDIAGYRNAQRPKSVEVVILGDSQAYGAGVAVRATWAQRLGVSVYNMAVPGYSPGQSVLQVDDALALRPRLLIVAPYFGNDFVEAYEMARRHPALARGVSPTLRQAAAVRNERMTIKREMELEAFAGTGSVPPGPSVVRRWISEHVKLYALLRAVWTRMRPPASPALLSRDFATAAATLTPGQRRLVSPLDGEWRTILTAGYRGRMVDDRDPRVRVGVEVARDALLGIAARCRAAGVMMMVVLMPTKESVFWPRVRDVAAHQGLAQLVADEARLKAELRAALARQDVPVIDPLEALRAAPRQPYFEDFDGHPNALGHAIIADALAEPVRRYGTQK
jgi:hypothetical protein